jgi:putative restriction endonuclease
MFVEMSVVSSHGGIGWEFTKCLWAPKYKLVKDDERKWPYWELLLKVKAGDTILHLRGQNNPIFVGYSIAATDGYLTEIKPSNPGIWGYAKKFIRVDLENYTELPEPLRLSDLFDRRKDELIKHYIKNSNSGKEKKLLFYTLTGGKKLGRQNGAYLSELDDDLFSIINVDAIRNKKTESDNNKELQQNIITGSVFSSIERRRGQEIFSRNVKLNFRSMCCYPDCDIDDQSFLVGAHVSRWADDVDARGDVKNGLCLCVFHDKCFEKGYFAIDDDLNVIIEDDNKFGKTIIKKLLPANGIRIKPSIENPDPKYLMKHRQRIGKHS